MTTSNAPGGAPAPSGGGPVDELRSAAVLLRQRAECAQQLMPGPWRVVGTDSESLDGVASCPLHEEGADMADELTAPLIPGFLARTNTRSAGAWQVMWDALEDREWHRGLDLVYAVERTALDMATSTLMMIPAKAARAGLLEMERRSGSTFLSRPNAPRVSGFRVWYRRPR